MPALWNSNTAAATFRFETKLAVWSPCNRLIAVVLEHGRRVDILDSATLQQLQSLKFPRHINTNYEDLVFSPDSRMLTSLVRNRYKDSGEFIVSWDLQTGGAVSEIRRGISPGPWANTARITYSTDGKVVAILFQCDTSTTVSIHDVVSGVHMHDVYHSLCTIPDQSFGAPYQCKIWAHGELFRFAAPEPKGISIWEVGFASRVTPTKVKSVSIPDNSVGTPVLKKNAMWTEFHPASCRLAFIGIGRTLLVWDDRASKIILRRTDTTFLPFMTFSSDGGFFACSTVAADVYLWKESPTGYTLFEKFTPGTPHPKPLLSPNGELITIFGSPKIQLYRTKGFTTTSSVLAQAPQHTSEDFVLEFLRDRSLAVTARKKDKTLAVLDLKSGAHQLNIDASMEIYGLRPIGNHIVVIGPEKAITWNLPGGKFLPDTRVGLEDSHQTISFRRGDDNPVFAASISLDLRYIALARHVPGKYLLDVYCTWTGRSLNVIRSASTLWFSPSGYDIWTADENDLSIYTITQDALKCAKNSVDIEKGSRGCPWGSSHGYKVTADGWILGADERRLLMLPPLWRSDVVQRVWSGQFLALLHGLLPEPVILELEA